MKGVKFTQKTQLALPLDAARCALRALCTGRASLERSPLQTRYIKANGRQRSCTLCVNPPTCHSVICRIPVCNTPFPKTMLFNAQTPRARTDTFFTRIAALRRCGCASCRPCLRALRARRKTESLTTCKRIAHEHNTFECAACARFHSPVSRLSRGGGVRGCGAWRAVVRIILFFVHFRSFAVSVCTYCFCSRLKKQR